MVTPRHPGFNPGSADDLVVGNLGVLAGVATKPICTIDAKLGYAVPLAQDANTRIGIYGEISTNTDTKPPNDRSEIDPDSITAYIRIFGSRHIGSLILYGIDCQLQPAGGEFKVAPGNKFN
jgi:hypothetical protein